MSKKTITPKITAKETTKVHQYLQVFTIVERNGNFNIAVGNKIITKKTFISIEDAENYIDSKPWELIVNATCCIYDLSKEINK